MQLSTSTPFLTSARGHCSKSHGLALRFFILIILTVIGQNGTAANPSLLTKEGEAVTTGRMGCGYTDRSQT